MLECHAVTHAPRRLVSTQLIVNVTCTSADTGGRRRQITVTAASNLTSSTCLGVFLLRFMLGKESNCELTEYDQFSLVIANQMLLIISSSTFIRTNALLDYSVCDLQLKRGAHT